MEFKHSAFFYTAIYIIIAVVLFSLERSGNVNVRPSIYILPILYTVSLLLNYVLYRSMLSRPAMMVNAIMISSLGRLLGFGAVIVSSVFLFREAVVYTTTTVVLLYLISVGGDLFFVRRFKS